MSNNVTIVDQNSAIFMQEFEKAVLAGYRAENTIAGYPTVRSLLKTVYLVDGGSKKAQESSFEPTGDKVSVVEYDGADYLLAVQKAILAGYELDAQSVVFDTLLTADLVKAKPKQVEKPVEKPAAKPKQTKKKEVTNGTN